jgi:hypothetical protein
VRATTAIESLLPTEIELADMQRLLEAAFNVLSTVSKREDVKVRQRGAGAEACNATHASSSLQRAVYSVQARRCQGEGLGEGVVVGTAAQHSSLQLCRSFGGHAMLLGDCWELSSCLGSCCQVTIIDVVTLLPSCLDA